MTSLPVLLEGRTTHDGKTAMLGILYLGADETVPRPILNATKNAL